MNFIKNPIIYIVGLLVAIKLLQKKNQKPRPKATTSGLQPREAFDPLQNQSLDLITIKDSPKPYKQDVLPLDDIDVHKNNVKSNSVVPISFVGPPRPTKDDISIDYVPRTINLNTPTTRNPKKIIQVKPKGIKPLGGGINPKSIIADVPKSLVFAERPKKNLFTSKDKLSFRF